MNTPPESLMGTQDWLAVAMVNHRRRLLTGLRADDIQGLSIEEPSTIRADGIVPEHHRARGKVPIGGLLDRGPSDGLPTGRHDRRPVWRSLGTTAICRSGPGAGFQLHRAPAPPWEVDRQPRRDVFPGIVIWAYRPCAIRARVSLWSGASGVYRRPFAV